MRVLFLASLLTLIAGAAPIPHSLAPHKTAPFLTQGFIKGGTETEAILKDLRYGKHPNKGYERWVFDFEFEGEKKQRMGSPNYCVKYQKPQGKNLPAKLVVLFQGIKKSRLNADTFLDMVSRSPLVASILLYPPIENGDTAIEFLLHRGVSYKTEELKGASGRLVVDLAPSSATGTL